MSAAGFGHLSCVMSQGGLRAVLPRGRPSVQWGETVETFQPLAHVTCGPVLNSQSAGKTGPLSLSGLSPLRVGVQGPGPGTQKETCPPSLELGCPPSRHGDLGSEDLCSVGCCFICIHLRRLAPRGCAELFSKFRLFKHLGFIS